MLYKNMTQEEYLAIQQWLQMQDDKIWITQIGQHMEEWIERYRLPGYSLDRRVI